MREGQPDLEKESHFNFGDHGPKKTTATGRVMRKMGLVLGSLGLMGGVQAEAQQKPETKISGPQKAGTETRDQRSVRIMKETQLQKIKTNKEIFAILPERIKDPQLLKLIGTAIASDEKETMAWIKYLEANSNQSQTAFTDLTRASQQLDPAMDELKKYFLLKWHQGSEKWADSKEGVSFKNQYGSLSSGRQSRQITLKTAQKQNYGKDFGELTDVLGKK